MNRPKTLLAAVLTTGAAGGIAVLGIGGTAPARPVKPKPCTAPAYQTHTVGSSFDGLKLTYANNSCEPSVALGVAASGKVLRPPRNDNTTFIYGDCQPSGPKGDPGGCTAPLEIQSAPACERNARRYQTADGAPYPHKNLRIRGVPAASYDEGTILEIYTGRTTISIFGDRPSQVRRAAEALYGLSDGQAPAQGATSSGYIHKFFAARLSATRRTNPLARPAATAFASRNCGS